MTFDSFAQTVQTFGASPSRWETDEINAWATTEEGFNLLQTEKELDDQLDLVQPPACAGLIERIQVAVMNEKAQRQILLFWKISPWISFLFMIGGFYLGWYENHLNYANTQSYFSTMFDTFYEQY